MNNNINGTKAEALISDSEGVSQEVEQVPALNAIDVINAVRLLLMDIKQETTESRLAGKLMEVMKLVDQYDNYVLNEARELKALTEEQASDKVVQQVGHKYGLTLNQVVGYLDICEKLNNDQGLQDCGVVAVPFWFHSQYNELGEVNAQLVQETDSLMSTLASIKNAVPASQLESLGLELPERKSIITGVSTPYIPGQTGPRLGDENLDQDNIYLGDVRGK